MKRLLSFLVLMLFLALPVCADATVATSTSRVKYNCNGSVTAFPFTFGVGATSEVQVILTSSGEVETTLTEIAQYTVSCTNNDCSSGGTVTTLSTYATGNTITILRNVPLTQEADFTEGMPTLYETFETGLDKLTRIAQQHEEKLNRTVVVPKSESTSGMTLPGAATRASRYLAFDGSGNPIASGGGPGSAEVPVSAYGATLIAAADAPAARAILSASAVLVGEIKIYAGSSAPTGWLICDGASYLRADYAALFAVIGTTYGAADGTHFNVPNFKGRSPIGVGQGNTAEGGGAGTDRTLGATAGSETETHTISIGEMPAHNHGGGAVGNSWSDGLATGGEYDLVIAQGANPSVTTQGSGTPITLDIMNPVLAVNFIIKY